MGTPGEVAAAAVCSRTPRGPLRGQLAALRMDEQAVRVHPVRRAGDERHQVASLLDGEAPRLLGQHRLNRRDPVGVLLAQRLDHEVVPHGELSQPVEDLRRGQAAVACEHGVRGLPWRTSSDVV